MDRRVAVAVVAALAVLAVAAAFVFWPRPASKSAVSGNASSVNATPASPQAVCILRVVNGSGYTVHVRGGRVCPARYTVEVNVWPGYRLRSVRVDGHEYNSSRFTVDLRENATLSVEVERVYVFLRVRVNASAPYLLNGSEHRGGVTVKVPFGSKVNITALPGAWRGFRLAPLNGSAVFEAEGNVTVRLFWRLTCGGAYLRSNVPLPGLPKCLSVPVTVEFPLEGPAINGTHRWWLAWYWVEENGSKWWWSPGINGSKLHITRPANVTLHYLPGLRDLPYVVRVYRWPEAYVRAGMRVWVGGGWVRANASRPFTFTDRYGSEDYYRYVVIFSVPGDAGLVEVEAYVPSGNGHITLYYLPWGGFTYAEVVCGKGLEVYSTDPYFDIENFGFGKGHPGIGLEVHAFAPARVTVLVNTSAFEEVWRRGRCKTPVNTLYPYVLINGRRHRWRSDEYYESGTTLNPIPAIKPLSDFTVYRKPGGKKLVLVTYFLWVKAGRPAPFLAARVKGVAP